MDEEEEEKKKEGQRRESKDGGERMRDKKGEKRGERDSTEDGGLMLADAVELTLCSIHCVMAASSSSIQSQHSCHSWTHPLQMVEGLKGASRGSTYS